MFQIEFTYLPHNRAGWTLPLTSILALLSTAANPTNHCCQNANPVKSTNWVERIRGSTTKEHNLQ